MDTREFVQKIYEEVVNGGDNGYRELFNSTKIERVTDPYFKAVLPFYASLSNDQKEILFSIMRQVAIDSLSDLFGILDGVSTIDDEVTEFSVSPSNKSTPFRYLQENFLAYDEQQG